MRLSPELTFEHQGCSQRNRIYFIDPNYIQLLKTTTRTNACNIGKLKAKVQRCWKAETIRIKSKKTTNVETARIRVASSLKVIINSLIITALVRRVSEILS